MQSWTHSRCGYLVASFYISANVFGVRLDREQLEFSFAWAFSLLWYHRSYSLRKMALYAGSADTQNTLKYLLKVLKWGVGWTISFLQTSATGFISLGSIPIQVLYGSDTSVIFPGDIGMSSIRGRLGNLPACSPRNFLLFYAVDSRNDGWPHAIQRAAINRLHPVSQVGVSLCRQSGQDSSSHLHCPVTCGLFCPLFCFAFVLPLLVSNSSSFIKEISLVLGCCRQKSPFFHLYRSWLDLNVCVSVSIFHGFSFFPILDKYMLVVFPSLSSQVLHWGIISRYFWFTPISFGTNRSKRKNLY